MTFHRYEPARRCTGKAQPGTKNLAAVCGEWPQANTGYPYGIYNCRLPAVHSEGRALDIGFPGVAHEEGTRLVQALVKNAWDLGLMGVIWNRTRWSAGNENGAPYTGPSPHTDHIHVEMTWYKAKDNPLTEAEAHRLLFTDEEIPVTPFYTELETMVVASGGNARSLFYTLELLRALAQNYQIPANQPKLIADAIAAGQGSPLGTYRVKLEQKLD